MGLCELASSSTGTHVNSALEAKAWTVYATLSQVTRSRKMTRRASRLLELARACVPTSLH